MLTAPAGLYLSGRAFACLCQGSVPSCPLEWWYLYSRDSANVCHVTVVTRRGAGIITSPLQVRKPAEWAKSSESCDCSLNTGAE